MRERTVETTAILPPCPTRRSLGVEQHVRQRRTPQEVGDRKRGLAAADDHNVEGIDGAGVIAHAGLAAIAPPVSMSIANLSGRSLARIAAASRATSYGTRMNSTGLVGSDASRMM